MKKWLSVLLTLAAVLCIVTIVPISADAATLETAETSADIAETVQDEPAAEEAFDGGDSVPAATAAAENFAVGAGETDERNAASSAVTALSRVTVTRAAYNGSDNTLEWNSVENATRYQIAKMKRGAGVYTYYETAATEYTDSQLVAADTYYYQVRAIYTAEGQPTVYGAWSTTKTVVTMQQPKVTLTNKSNGIRAEWNAVGGAKSYIVYYKTASAAAWSSVTTANTYYPLFNVTSGTLYYVQVRPVGVKANGPYSKVSSMTFIGQPAVTVSQSGNSAVLRWNAVEGANLYEIAYKEKNDAGFLYKFTHDTTDAESGLSADCGYFYQVRAICDNEAGGSVSSAWSSVKSVRMMAQPAVTLTNKTNGIRADWNAVKGATQYTVYYKAHEDAKWSSAVTANTYFSVTGTFSGKVYHVQVRPAAGKVNGPYSKVSSITFLGQANPKGSADDTTLSWNAVAGANQYQIAQKAKNASGFIYFTVQDTAYTDHAENAKTDCCYQIRAVYADESGAETYGAWSAVCRFINGKALNGYQTGGGKKYYYQNGVLQKNRIVGTSGEGYYYADGSGVCCVSEEMRLAAEFIMRCGKGNTLDERMKTCFKYLADNYPYARSYDHPKSKADIPALAIDMFKNKKGNCFRYAACFTCVARICGYRSRIGVGSTGNGSPHGWTEVYMDGQWYYFDPDMQLPGYGFPDYYAYKMSRHPWNVRTTFTSEVTLSGGKAVWN